MNILENYLYFLMTEQKSAWKKRVASGELSRKNIERIRKAGISKSKDEYIKGVEKGTKNIIKKSGGVLFEPKKDFIGSGPMSIDTPIKKTVYVPKDPNKFKGFFKDVGIKLTDKDYNKAKPYIKRHEADELRVKNKMIKKYGKIGDGNVDFFTSKKNGQTYYVGKHTTPEVLKAEDQLTSFANNMYGDAKKLKQIRNKTGEVTLIKDLTKKYLKKVEKEIIRQRKENLSFVEKQISKMKIEKSKGILGFLKDRLKMLLTKKALIRSAKTAQILF